MSLPLGAVLDFRKFNVDGRGFLTSVQKVVKALTDAGEDAEAFFAAYAKGQNPPRPACLPVPDRSIDQLIQFLQEYGPAIFAMVSALFGWSVIPVPAGFHPFKVEPPKKEVAKPAAQKPAVEHETA